MKEEIVGLRFYPTAYELVNHYLRGKLRKIDKNRCMIPVVDIYDYDPRDLHAIYNEKSSWRSTSPDCFFFCARDKTNPNSARNRRQTRGGYWKVTSQKQDIKDEETGETIGTKRILVFYRGKQGNAQKTEFAMHEYHLNADSADATIIDPMAFSLCHVKRKMRSKISNSKKQQSKKGNSMKQQSKKGNTPLDKVDSCSPDTFVGSDEIEDQDIAAQLRTPQTELQNFGRSDIAARVTREDERVASDAAPAQEEGLSELDREWVQQVLSDLEQRRP